MRKIPSIHDQECVGVQKSQLEQRGSTVAQQIHNNVKVNKTLIMLEEKMQHLKGPLSVTCVHQ